jgi:hypothetical protein
VLLTASECASEENIFQLMMAISKREIFSPFDSFSLFGIFPLFSVVFYPIRPPVKISSRSTCGTSLDIYALLYIG